MLSPTFRLLNKSIRCYGSGWAIPISGGVRKDAPLASFLEEYSRVFFDDTITKDDPTVSRLRDGILAGHRASLASAITLVESTNPRKRAQGNVLLQEMLKEEKRRFDEKGVESLIYRVAISGSPGVGKSSFIEALGKELTENRGKNVAVLTIDPSSKVTGGSLLGDLTRMQNLSVNPRAYIRQSPSCGALGGVARGIHEAIILCEGAGYDVVIIETVGVGQSEVSVVDMCDMLTLLLSPAHGDELQGVKRGIMELSDLLVVTKDDGDLKAKAKIAQAEHISALKFMRPRSREWKPKVRWYTVDVIIETVGVGQSEVSVVDMCDMLTLLLSPAHGDELQGVKRGIMELSDLLVVTKDDGDLKAKAKIAQAEHISALKFMRPRSREWKPKVLRSSIMDPVSVSAVWDECEEYWKTIALSGTLMKRRDEQMHQCMWRHVEGQLMALFTKHPNLVAMTKEMEKRVRLAEITPGQAADNLVRTFFGIKHQ